MRRYFLIDSRLMGIRSHDILDRISRESFSSFEIAEVDEQIRTVIAPGFEKLFEFFSGALGEEYRSHFLSFTDHPELVAVELDVCSLE